MSKQVTVGRNRSNKMQQFKVTLLVTANSIDEVSEQDVFESIKEFVGDSDVAVEGWEGGNIEVKEVVELS